jgi:hypothetical protein
VFDVSGPGQDRGDAPPDEVVEATIVEPDPAPTSPADLEHVPLKVVPMYVDEDPVVEPAVAPQPERRRRPFIGIAALVLALGAGGLHIAAVIIAAGGGFETGTLLAWLAIGASVLGFAVGAVAVIGGWGRRLGLLGAVLAVLVNPWVVLRVLGLLGAA